MSDKEKKPRKSPEKNVSLSPEEPKKAKKEKEKKDKPEKAVKLEAVDTEAAPKKKKKAVKDAPEPIGEVTASESAPEIAATEKNPPAHGEISERAYFYFVERGYQDGFDAEDWLRAERELWEQA
jgi:hypothetical protein